MPSASQQSLKENAPISKRPGRKNRGIRSRKRISNLDRHSCCWDKSSACEPLLATSRDSLTSEESSQTTQGADSLAVECFATPAKGHRTVNVVPQNGISSPELYRTPFRPLDATTNRSRPPFLSPLHSPTKPRNGRTAKPVRAMMDIFLDSRTRSDESDDETLRDIGRRLRMSNYMSTPESPTPPSSRASSQGMDSLFSTPMKASGYSSPGKSPRRRSGFYPWRVQESPLKPTIALGADKPWALASRRDGFWRKEAERLRLCAPKILLPSWHLSLTGEGDGEETERLMTLAEVSLAEMDLEMNEVDLSPSERRRFEVSGERSTANWS